MLENKTRKFESFFYLRGRKWSILQLECDKMLILEDPLFFANLVRANLWFKVKRSIHTLS